MLEIEQYTHDKHYELVNTWLKHYGIVIPSKDLFSDLGLVVDKKAIGFLYTTNSSQAYIDQVIASPEATKEDRRFALQTLFASLQEVALKQDCRVIRVLSNPLIEKYVAETGYVDFGPYNLYCKFI